VRAMTSNKCNAKCMVLLPHSRTQNRINGDSELRQACVGEVLSGNDVDKTV
jgi:hypothetical protein